MIIRLVTMTFKKSEVDNFLSLFEEFKEQIRNQPGCIRLELIQDIENPIKISTLSKWNSVNELNNYRHSELFGIVWPKTKKLFAEKPMAQSFEVLTALN